MSKIEIKQRFTDAVLFECEIPEAIAAQCAGKQLGYAVKEALKARANLADAYLADADLADAYLARADLAGAYLADAYLAGAYLAHADLAGAYLAGAYLADANLADAYLADAYLAGADLARANLAHADLAGAYLAGAYLGGADLAGAYLADANLSDAYLTGAYLTGADLAGAYLADANLADAYNVPEANGTESIQHEPADRKERARLRAERFRVRNPDVPVIENLDAKILAAVTSGVGKLDMSAWHTCETTHCRAGWAITLAGPAGAALEEKYGPFHAGVQIYRASTGVVPHFYASTERAMEDIRKCAEESAS